jgi:hypothetical protein
MDTESEIDIAFDFRSDTPGYPKKDPDVCSPTLRRYHKYLWNKPLPSGVMLTLDDTTQHYLHHRSVELGELFLASDAVIPTFRKERSLGHVIDAIPDEEHENFLRLGYTIGGMMVFPGQREGRKMTINGARGFHPRIKDRFDLTVECIRRHYCNEWSPLQSVLARYASFFDLFGDFRGYVEFFLLQDLVAEDYSVVTLFPPFKGFSVSPLPASLNEYLLYREHAMNFIRARNTRILLTSKWSRRA